MKTHYRILVLGLLLGSNATRTWAQQQATDTEQLLNLSLEELMNIKIESASKKAEHLFDAPLSASVLTREEIRKAGVTSLTEAFRLMPGLIVREQSNGNFDVHLRGMNNLPLTASYAVSSNTTTLVMIDGRPVYSYLQGGTFWETLPIDINDIARIEVVRGPSSAMYGPNAVSGVINIITSRPEQDGLYATGNGQVGSHQTYIANTSLGYQFNNKLNLLVSGNLQQRDRTQTSYYETFRNVWVANPDSLLNSRGVPEANLPEKFAQPELALQKYGANAFLTYTPNSKIKFNVAAGLQDSKVQKVYFESASTPLTTNASQSNYLDVKAEAGRFTSQFSYLGGTYNTQVGAPGLLYDFKCLDATVEYTFSYQNLSLKPGLNFRQSITDDGKYTEALKQQGTFTGSNFNGYHQITTNAASLRGEYSALDSKLRLIAALRVDRFNFPDQLFPSYQLVANYKVNEGNLVRAVYARSNQSPFINDAFLNLTPTRLPIRVNGQVKPGHFAERRVLGNMNLELLTSDMIELGYRSKLADNLQLDIELFSTMRKNFATTITSKVYTDIKGAGDTVQVTPSQYQNLPLSARQLGLTLSVNYVASKLQLKPFLTLQATKMYDYSDFSNTPDAPASPNPATGNLGNPDKNNLNSGIGTVLNHQGTPAVYGGAFINYQLNRKFNLNLNPYAYSETTFYNRVYTDFRDGQRGIDQLPGKVLLNATLTYTPIKPVSVFISGKNLSNDKTREFYRADEVGASYVAGVHFKL